MEGCGMTVEKREYWNGGLCFEYIYDMIFDDEHYDLNPEDVQGNFCPIWFEYTGWGPMCTHNAVRPLTSSSQRDPVFLGLP